MAQWQIWSICSAIVAVTACDSGGPPNICENNSECFRAPAYAVEAVDGDTFDINGQRLRLVGWDSPESAPHAKCEAEASLGSQVEIRVKEVLSAGELVQIKTAGRDQFGRLRAHMFVDGKHLGHILSKEGLSKKWNEDEGADKPDWCG